MKNDALKTTDVYDWEKAKNWVFTRLLPKDVPVEEGVVQEDFLDLKLVYALRIHDDGRWYFIDIQRELLDSWQVDMCELKDRADAYIMDNEKFYMDCLRNVLGIIGPNAGMRMCIIHNETYSHGASVITCGKKMKQCADALESELYVLPCSQHEVIAVPVSDYHYETDCLREIISSVNPYLGEDEFLSDTLYYCDRSGNVDICRL